MIIPDFRWRVYEKMSKRRNERTRRKKMSPAAKKRRIQRNIRIGVAVLAVLTVIAGAIRIMKPSWLTDDYFELDSDAIDACRPEIDVELLTVNPYSRPGTETKKIRGLVIHYTANPGARSKDSQGKDYCVYDTQYR